MRKFKNRPRGSWFFAHLSTASSTLEAFFQMRLGWLVPLVVLLFLITLLLVGLNASGPLAPFVYPLF